MQLLNNVKSQFSIKDLENLSGIMAHTIRIWEKRYSVLEPERSDSNIRSYNLSNLQKLLNVTLLYNAGFKISKIASLTDEQLEELIREQAASSTTNEQFLVNLKLSMLKFDQSLFDQTYNRMVAELTFRKAFIEVFIPFLYNIGLDWQSSSITPAHEHFISNLIKQKLHLNTERVQQTTDPALKTVYVLFLPTNEIHELGLLYLQYELVLKGHKCIFLGQSVPLDSLSELTKIYDNLRFLSYFTVQPHESNVQEYIDEANEIMDIDSNSFWFAGRQCVDADVKLHKNNKMFKKIEDLLNNL